MVGRFGRTIAQTIMVVTIGTVARIKSGCSRVWQLASAEWQWRMESPLLILCLHGNSKLSLHQFKPVLIDAWRWGTMPYRVWAHASARRNGRMPIGVLFYHRVADDDPNPWTISCDGFQKQLDWLSENFEILSLCEAQRRIRNGHNRQPAICITFDDGYADNSTFALPLLIKRNIPVTYFVTTSHITQGQPFSHDVQRGRPLPPNAPETLRALADAGVEIGGHTRNHPSLADIEDPQVLFDEVVAATQEMEQIVGRKIRYFAFPFGQIENLSAAVFRMAREYGFAGICSAYGGWNEIGTDAFHLQRFHGDPRMAYLKNWLTLDPRKRHVWQTRLAEQMLNECGGVSGCPASSQRPSSFAREG